MKKNAVALPFAVGAFLLLAACGDDVTKTTVNETGISQLAAGDEFPKCSEEESGEMLYAADSGKAYICTGKAWTPLHGESSADTVVVRDTLVQKDSVFFSQVNTLVIRDTLFGLNGESCTAETLEDSSGYKIVCGTDSVGVVLNGNNGEKGDGGESCTVADSGNGVVAVQCESDTVKLYKALCANEPYDPLKSLCKGEKLYSCDGKPYDPSESFCYNGGAKDTIVTLCDGNEYGLDTGFCANGTIYSCNHLPYDPAKSFCYNDGSKDTIVTLCGGNAYDLGESFCGKTLASNDTVLFYDTLSTTYLNQTMLAAGDYGYLLDTRDGQVYRTTTIGTQTWMAQNLNYAYNKGTATSYCYSDDTSNCTKYGRLYLWSAAMDSAAVFSTDGSGCGYSVTCSATEPVRGVCPEGWHLPSSTEWEALFTAVGGQDVAGTKLKATSGWDDNGYGTDDYGFSALPAGDRYDYGDGRILYRDAGAVFLIPSELSERRVLVVLVHSLSDEWGSMSTNKSNAYSVRCVLDGGSDGNAFAGGFE